jgi:hypothetical protein
MWRRLEPQMTSQMAHTPSMLDNRGYTRALTCTFPRAQTPTRMHTRARIRTNILNTFSRQQWFENAPQWCVIRTLFVLLGKLITLIAASDLRRSNIHHVSSPYASDVSRTATRRNLDRWGLEIRVASVIDYHDRPVDKLWIDILFFFARLQWWGCPSCFWRDFLYQVLRLSCVMTVRCY